MNGGERLLSCPTSKPFIDPQGYVDVFSFWEKGVAVDV